MKNVFYYFFGIITALYAFVVLFDIYAPEFIDDYWLDILYDKYAQGWYYSNITVGAVMILCTIIWVYNLGRGVRELEEKEPLLIKKEEKEDE